MKIKDKTGNVEKIICNKCGQEIKKVRYFSDWLEINKRWGYDSNYDNCIHKFDICQSCYEKFISEFSIQITV